MNDTRLPALHQALSHDTLRTRLLDTARLQFEGESGPTTWNPQATDDRDFIDLGRGLLDCYALALHVLWTYEQAWGEEGYLPTAKLASSVDKLLAQIGYQPQPGTAATGLQHFRCKSGATGILPAGFQVRSPALADEPDAIYETLDSKQLAPAFNEMRAFLPLPAKKSGLGGGKGAPLNFDPDEPGEPVLDGTPFVSPTSIGDALRNRINKMRFKPPIMNASAAARAEAKALAALIDQLSKQGADPCTIKAITELCDKLCIPQNDANNFLNNDVIPKTVAPTPLSESQEILARMLRVLEKTQRAAILALGKAMARCKAADGTYCETEQQYRKRLDELLQFLDAFVAALLQEARDSVVLIQGSDALTRLDRVFGANQNQIPPLGLAAPGTSQLYLLPFPTPPVSAGPEVQLRPGDYIMMAEDIESAGADGKITVTRYYREAIRLTAVRQHVKTVRGMLTQIEFTPPLSRLYRLDRTVLIGNIAQVSHGSAVDEAGVVSADGRTIPLSKAPLTWLRDPLAQNGRRPEVTLTVNGRVWTRVDDLLEAGAHDAVFAVENVPGGGARLRVGDGEAGASLPPDAALALHYRIGLGAAGNRAATRISQQQAANPAVETTFNPLPTNGGADAQATGDARVSGPLAVAAMDRAVSVADVQALALKFDPVHRARVFRDTRHRRALTAIVSGPDAAALVAADLQALQDYLRVRVPPGVTITAVNRELAPLRMHLLLRVVKGANPIQIIQDVRLRLGVDSDPSEPEGLLDPDRVDLGVPLALSDIYGALDGVDGLHSSLVKLLYQKSDPKRLNDRIDPKPRELLVWDQPTDGTDGVAIAYEEARDR